MLIFLLTLIEDEDDIVLFEHLFTTYYQSVFICAKQILGNDNDAEDALQEAFTNIALNIKRYDFRNNPRNLILTFARNAAISVKRKQGDEHDEAFIDGLIGVDEIDRNSDIQRAFDIKEDINRIYDIIDQLNPIYSVIFLLRFRRGLSYRQISEITGISVNTAKKQVQRLKEIIKHELEKNQ